MRCLLLLTLLGITQLAMYCTEENLDSRITVDGVRYEFYTLRDGWCKHYMNWVGQWTVGACWFRGTHIAIPQHLCTFTGPTSCDHEEKDKRWGVDKTSEDRTVTDLVNYYVNMSFGFNDDSIDDILTLLVDKQCDCGCYVINVSDVDKKYQMSDIMDLCELEQCCSRVQATFNGSYDGVVICDHESLILLDRDAEQSVIHELQQVNAVAKSENVMFEWI